MRLQGLFCFVCVYVCVCVLKILSRWTESRSYTTERGLALCIYQHYDVYAVELGDVLSNSKLNYQNHRQ